MRQKCPMCGEDGDNFPGRPKAAVYHFLHRAIWQLHRLRQSAEKDGQGELAKYVSSIIRGLEDLVSRMFDDGRH